MNPDVWYMEYRRELDLDTAVARTTYRSDEVNFTLVDGFDWYIV
jgi:hypothetical protein